jgi:Uma2 family endonuclease
MDALNVLPARHKLDVDDYRRMAEAGILGPEDRIELIDGDLIDMAPIGEAHAAIVTRLAEALFIACAGRAIVSPQNPVRLDRRSEPQPDLAILRRRADFYASERPGPADILLLVEVADTSLRFDRTVKLPLYARAGIGEVWIVDLKRGTLDAYRRPVGEGYAESVTHHAGDQIALALAPDIAVEVGLVLG